MYIKNNFEAKPSEIVNLLLLVNVNMNRYLLNCLNFSLYFRFKIPVLGNFVGRGHQYLSVFRWIQVYVSGVKLPKSACILVRLKV